MESASLHAQLLVAASQVEVAISSPESRFQTFRVLSSDAETTRIPSPLIASPKIEDEWPVRVRSSAPPGAVSSRVRRRSQGRGAASVRVSGKSRMEQSLHGAARDRLPDLQTGPDRERSHGPKSGVHSESAAARSSVVIRPAHSLVANRAVRSLRPMAAFPQSLRIHR